VASPPLILPCPACRSFVHLKRFSTTRAIFPGQPCRTRGDTWPALASAGSFSFWTQRQAPLWKRPCWRSIGKAAQPRRPYSPKALGGSRYARVRKNRREIHSDIAGDSRPTWRRHWVGATTAGNQQSGHHSPPEAHRLAKTGCRPPRFPSQSRSWSCSCLTLPGAATCVGRSTSRSGSVPGGTAHAGTMRYPPRLGAGGRPVLRSWTCGEPGLR